MASRSVIVELEGLQDILGEVAKRNIALRQARASGRQALHPIIAAKGLGLNSYFIENKPQGRTPCPSDPNGFRAE